MDYKNFYSKEKQVSWEEKKKKKKKKPSMLKRIADFKYIQ